MTKDSSIDRAWAAQFETLIEEQGTEAILDDVAPFSIPLGQQPELLTPEEMGRADTMTIEGGTPGIALMEAAGLAVADAVRAIRPAGGRVAVLTGPGNNGGDGFVAARLLQEAGYTTNVWMQSSREKLSGDAAFAAASWTGTAKGLSTAVVADADVIVDAIFGAGLSKPITGMTTRVFDAINESGVPVVAVDLPSGVDGASGQVLGSALKARETVTFFRKKPGHILFPGRRLCGRVSIADIGIADTVLATIKPKTRLNQPDFWGLPALTADGHKYDRGHAVAVAGPATATGAARLAARGALRCGAGLVTVAASAPAAQVVAAHVTAIMVREVAGASGLTEMLADARLNAVVMGPGLGVGAPTRNLVEAALDSKAALVLDADALTSFVDAGDALFGKIAGRASPVVLTPHEGEFGKLFGDLAALPSKLDRARQAAARSGAVVVLKGPDTVIASPDGYGVINDNAPPQLATAGSGDVLAGMICGLLAQRMGAFQAAAAGVWLHGAAGQRFERGLIAEDLPESLPGVFTSLGL